MLKFGAVTIDVSHPKTFSGVLLKGERGRYTAVFNDGFRGEDEVQGFAEGLGLKICDSIEELADSVDIGMVHSCNWDKHIDYAMPFIERGKPVFIDKPLVGNLKDARRMLELCKNGAKIIGTSALRYTEEVSKIRAFVKETGARVMHVDVSVGVDEFNYAIHGLETICAIIGDKPKSAKYLGQATSDSEVLDSYMITFEGGATACYHNFGKKFTLFHTLVLTDGAGEDADFAFTMDKSKLYVPMIENVCDYLDGKENNLAAMEDMLIPIKASLACKASRLSGGKEISLDDPILEEISFDGYEFEKAYSANAKKLYVKQ
jgi:hypothetical protein